MKKTSLWKTALVLLAGFGTLLPNQLVHASEKTTTIQKATVKASVLDVSLDKSGKLSGFVVDAQGKPQANEAVSVLQGRSVVAKATTDAKGRFEVTGLKGGVYGIQSAKGMTAYRVWTTTAAPKTSKEFAVVVKDNNLVRAQDDGSGLGGILSSDTGSYLLGGAAITGVIVGAIALKESGDNKDANASLRAQNAALQQQIDQLQQSLSTP